MTAIRVVVQFAADSIELADRAVANGVERAKNVQKESGCLQFEIFRSVAEPTRWSLIELWASQEVLDARGTPPAPPQGVTRIVEHYEQHA